MILHITFSDGSNPYVAFPRDRRRAAVLWQRWMKHYPMTAQPTAHSGGYICELSPDRLYTVFKRGDYHATKKYYSHLGHALAALERKGGGTA